MEVTGQIRFGDGTDIATTITEKDPSDSSTVGMVVDLVEIRRRDRSQTRREEGRNQFTGGEIS